MRDAVIAVLLLSATFASAQARVETFPVPAGHLPTEIARHGDVLAFVSWKNWPSIEPHLGRVTTKGRIQLDALAKDHMPGLFSLAPDGTLWISDGRKPVLWRVRPNGKAEQVPITRTTIGVAIDPDGSIWATHPQSAEITRYGTDGQTQAQWFIGRKRGPAGGAPSMAIPKPRVGPAPKPKAMSSDRSLTKEERKTRTLDARPSYLVVGPDEAVWFSEPTWRTIGRVTHAGKIGTFEYPREWGEPRRIIAGADGALWFALANVMALGRITPEGDITTIDLPYGAGALAADSKKRVWFADASGAQIGYVDAEGKVHEVPMPEGKRLIRSMAEGPDGAMWFADQTSKVIGRIALP